MPPTDLCRDDALGRESERYDAGRSTSAVGSSFAAVVALAFFYKSVFESAGAAERRTNE